MALLDDLYAGAVLGLLVSMRVLIGQLPNNKLSFFVCGFLCYLLLGGFASACLKLLVCAGTYFLNVNLGAVLVWMSQTAVTIWDRMARIVMGGANHRRGQIIEWLATLVPGLNYIL